jgi:hypothetical protein
MTAAQVRAAQAATIELGRAQALGTPSADTIRATQTRTGFTPADGRMSAAYRAHLARQLASQASITALPPPDRRQLAARQLAAYILTQSNPSRDVVAGFQRQLGVEATGAVNVETARAIQTQFGRV